MPSPFPGMNPYLERATACDSFHPHFIATCFQYLAAQLRPEYVIRIENRVYITVLDAVEVDRVGYLTIRDRDGNDLVTLIEVLSPTNKYGGPDREQYIGKRNEILRSRAHFVEIDLLRGGPRMPPPEIPHCDYCALVSRVEERPQAGVWPWRLRESLPELPIPLRSPDPDAMLNLKTVLDQAYDTGRYANYIYNGPPEPRLTPADAAWAAAFVPATTGGS